MYNRYTKELFNLSISELFSQEKLVATLRQLFEAVESSLDDAESFIELFKTIPVPKVEKLLQEKIGGLHIFTFACLHGMNNLENLLSI